MYRFAGIVDTGMEDNVVINEIIQKYLIVILTIS